MAYLMFLKMHHLPDKLPENDGKIEREKSRGDVMVSKDLDKPKKKIACKLKTIPHV